MKITTKIINKDEEEEIIIKTYDENAEWVQYVYGINSRNISIVGMYEGRTYKISLKDIYYFESVDGKTFIYSKTYVFSCKLKLYEIEDICSDHMFFRVSKAMIVNAKMIENIRPSLSGRFEMILNNGEKIMVNRHYVTQLKEKLGL